MHKHLLLAAFANQAWAMDQAHLTTFASVLHRWSSGESVTPEIMAQVEAAKAARASRAKSSTNIGSGIAVLPLYGVMAQRANMADDVSGSGGTSTQAFTAALRDAMDDDSVGGIIIDIDSPGGSVFGTGELAAEIFNARGKKPIYGYVNSLCASAAYWTGAQCAQLFITSGGQAGSVGVYMQHIDESAAMDKAGYKAEFISAGKYKVEGNSLAPLDDDARASLQKTVDAYYTSFTSAVAKGRGVPVASVRSGFGEGRCLLAQDALSAGMVDGICTFDEVVSRMSKAIKSGGSGARARSIELDVEAEGLAQTIDSQALVDNTISPVTETTVVDPLVNKAHLIRMAARKRELELISA